MTHIILIRTTVPPTFVTHPQETVDAVEWREVTLNCSASGSPTSLITWEREGQTQLPVGPWGSNLSSLCEWQYS